MVIALDLEGVLADILAAWVKEYEKEFRINDVTDWDFTSLRKWNETLEKFLFETDHLWNNNYTKIPPLIANIKKATDRLKPFDIVTSRHTLDGIKLWLDLHNIDYRAIVYIPDKKPVLNYKTFIDDNPYIVNTLKDEQFLWLIDHPYNRSVQEKENIKRISSINEVE